MRNLKQTAIALATLLNTTACGITPTATLMTLPTSAGDHSYTLQAAAAGQGKTSGANRWMTQPAQGVRTQFRTFYSQAARSEVSYHLYVPAAYEQQRRQRFPVLYWLHGTGAGTSAIPFLTEQIDQAIRAGKLPPMLVVFPNGQDISMWSNSKDGKTPMETVVVKELVPHLDRTFRTQAQREGRLLEGMSMGGYGAARLGFEHSQTFGAISMLGAGPLDLAFQGPKAEANPALREGVLSVTFGNDMAYYQKLSPWRTAERQARHLRGRLKLRMLIGERDFTLADNEAFRQHLSKLGLRHEYRTVPGVGHKLEGLVTALGDEYWTFFRNALNAR
ncbi:MAG: alpha/beta hydrolase-fold protein [Candidatus Sericytochromatia bacterium]|nr:alpha/beta hydrolase-fold protein [Candidatus Sericytochromatia bacterium]